MTLKSGFPDVLIIQPGSSAHTYQGLHMELTAIEPPIWGVLLSSFLKGKGVRSQVLDANALGLSSDQLALHVEDLGPALIVVLAFGHQPSASTQTMPAVRQVCQAIKSKNPQRKILLVGGHVAALPERTLQEESADFVCSGEGFQTALDLVQCLKSGSDNFDKVQDLYFKEGSEIRSTFVGKLLSSLETEIPKLVWDDLSMGQYRAHNWHCFGETSRQPYVSLYTTLGCPFRCHFCCIHSIFSSAENVGTESDAGAHSYRFWNPDWIIQQIEFLVKNHGMRNIKIADEMFVLNARHVEGLCDKILERGLDLNLWAYARVDTVTDRLIEKMRRAGFRWLAFGVESASEHVRDDSKKFFKQEKIFKTLQSVRSSGISVIANYIFGLPEDNLSTMKDTLKLAIELNTEFANFYSAMAYPGSPLYREALKEGWPLPGSWSGYSQHSEDSFPLPTRHLYSSEVLKFRDEAFQKYFKNPSYRTMILKKFGNAVWKEIELMLSQPLHRSALPAVSVPMKLVSARNE